MRHGKVQHVVPAERTDPRLREEAFAAIAGALVGLAAAWVAVGSTGLLGHPLRRAITLLLLGIAILLQHPLAGDRPKTRLALLLSAFVVAACMATRSLPAVNAMAPAIVLAMLAFMSAGRRRSIFLVSSTAVAVFALYRMMIASIPWLWLAADFEGQALGRAAGWIAGRPIWIGATFAGLDFLILTSILWGLYLPHTKSPRIGRAIYGFAGILGAHMVYLILLSYIPDLLAAAPVPAEGVDQPGHALRLFHQAVPWNLPLLACAIHLAAAAAIFRWSALVDHDDATFPPTPVAQPRARIAVFALALASLLPVIAVLHPVSSNLAGKKIVFYEKGFLNWLRPAHGSYGRLSSGMYGMLPVLMESLGAKSLVSADLAEKDLADADVLALIFPDEPWQEGQLDRIHSFVRRGGSLLVLGEHTTQDESGNSRFNEVLASTAVRVEFDSATFAVGGWLQSYEALSHPATAGIDDDQNRFGVVIGASVVPRWPARPLLVGRWGWSDYGDEASPRAMMGNDRYDAGEKLGDLVLAAEQPVGKGHIVTFGDTSGLTNAIDVSSHVFTTRLFAYLADHGTHAHPAWRQVLALAAAGILAGMLCRRPDVRRTTLAAIALTVSLAVCTAANRRGADPLPDGRRENPNNLAYIDASHIGANSEESWRPDGIGGLALTLMRNGYLTLDLPEWTPERLRRAGLLVSIAPSRRFSKAEVEAVKAFVNDGGIFIMTVGYEQRGPAEPLLDAFGLWVGSAEDRSIEPVPLGHFKSPYLESEGRRVYVRFHAAWPVACRDAGAQAIAYGQDNRPVIILRRHGKGAVLLIGDTCFAMNMNLEYESGEPFEGLRENADFWRWLLSILRNEPMWVPPMLEGNPAGATRDAPAGEVGS